MDEHEFQRWVDLLEKRTGVVVPPSRRLFLETNLRMRLQELGYRNLARYRDECLVGPKGAKEWAVLVDRLTVHETRFFRHPPSLDLVRDQLLPAYLEQGASEAFHAWSIGCATGEEVYSLAMVIDEFTSRQEQSFYFGITGSDVSPPALAVGRQGIYASSRLKEIPEKYRQEYCERFDDNHFRVADRLKRRVGFAVLNLLDVQRQPMTRLDLIYCQNVLIYFPRVRRHELLNHLVTCLKPGGCLILGAGEVTLWSNPLVQRVSSQRTLAFRRKAQGEELGGQE
ncbi:MAG: protein-glutamate O-methyltransferase CheR [Xanthomonadales bacterium]|nr:protein-glutamate O-methyltransferase CheR [Xanthomonadales bacterium]